MRITMTGATGHSGRWFIERLKKENFDGELVCLVRKDAEQAHLDDGKLNVKKVFGTIEGGFEQDKSGKRTDRPTGENNALKAALEGTDVFLHIAGIQVSEIVIPLAREANVEWCILVHTTGRYSKYKSASSEYIKTEDEILKMRNDFSKGKFSSGTNITIVRPTMIYGSNMDVNMHKLIKYLKTIKFFPLFGSGENLMQPVHARDLGNAYYDILIRPDITKGKEYNLSGKAPMQYKAIIKTTSDILVDLGVRKSKNIIIKIPFKLSVFAAKVYNFIFRNKAIITVEQVLRMQEDKDFSFENAQIDFGYSPISFQEGINEEIQKMMSEGII